MGTSVSHGAFNVATGDLKTLGADLKRADALAAKAASKRMKSAAMIVANEAKARASWSSRIPGSIRPSVTGTLIAKVVAGGPKAPDAAPYEHEGNPGQFRHPVFGNTNNWAAQTARPFLAPALDATVEELAEEIGLIIDDVLAEVGFE